MCGMLNPAFFNFKMSFTVYLKKEYIFFFLNMNFDASILNLKKCGKSYSTRGITFSQHFPFKRIAMLIVRESALKKDVIMMIGG